MKYPIRSQFDEGTFSSIWQAFIYTCLVHIAAWEAEKGGTERTGWDGGRCLAMGTVLLEGGRSRCRVGKEVALEVSLRDGQNFEAGTD